MEGELAACGGLLNYSCASSFIQEHGRHAYRQCLQFLSHQMTEEEYLAKERAIFVCYGCILTAVCFLGVIGNAISFKIMLAPEFRKSSTTPYLQALMVMDSLYLMANFFHHSLLVAFGVSEWWFDALPSYSRVYVHYALIDMIRNCSALLITAVTVERYIVVCHGLTATRICKLGRRKMAAALLILMAIVYEIPRFVILKVERTPIPSRDNSTDCDPVYIYAIRPSGVIPELAENCINIGGTVVFVIIPLLALVGLTGRLLKTIRDSGSFHRQSFMTIGQQETQGQTRRHNERHTTVVLLSVVIAFIVCNLPNTFIALTRLTAESLWDSWNLTLAGSVFYYIAILLLNVNSAANVVLFCFFGQKFRRAFARTFARCRGRLREYRPVTVSNHTTVASMKSVDMEMTKVGGEESTTACTPE